MKLLFLYFVKKQTIVYIMLQKTYLKLLGLSSLSLLTAGCTEKSKEINSELP